MAELYFKQDFSTKEITWKTKNVQMRFVAFEMHQRIKELLKNEISLHNNDLQEISYNIENDSIWEIAIKGNGAESYFCVRMLFMALARIKSGTANIESLNRKIIEDYTNRAAVKAGISELGFDSKARYENELYKITVPIFGSEITFADRNPDILCKIIGSHLRAFFKPKE